MDANALQDLGNLIKGFGLIFGKLDGRCRHGATLVLRAAPCQRETRLQRFSSVTVQRRHHIIARTLGGASAAKVLSRNFFCSAKLLRQMRQAVRQGKRPEIIKNFEYPFIRHVAPAQG